MISSQQVDVYDVVIVNGMTSVFVRVHEKPYVELKDSDGRPDGVVAKEVVANARLVASHLVTGFSSHDINNL